MTVIHQIYCTHCTCGTSALERREGELAAHVVGYDARAGSIKGNDLRQRYRQLSTFLRYQLPLDATKDDNLRFDADTAPRRLFYYPAGNNLRILAHFCHRQTDSSPSRRPGCYFGHVLFADAGEPWPVLDCLRLWGAPWVDRDSPAIKFDLPTLPSLDVLLAGKPPAINDAALISFLATPPGGKFRDPGRVIPDRWRAAPAADRVALLVDCMQSYLTVVAANRRGSVLVAVEPSVAALLFYGVARLLPEGPLRHDMSFSTFEPELNAVSVALAGTTLFSPLTRDLPADVYHRMAFVRNTYMNKTCGRRPAESVYVKQIVQSLLSEGWGPVDRTLAEFQAAGVKSPADLEVLGKAQAAVTPLLESAGPPGDVSWQQTPVARVYVGQSLCRKLNSSPLSSLNELVNSERHLLLLDLMGTEANTSEAQGAIQFLLHRLPASYLPHVLSSSHVALRHKAEAVAHYVNQNRQFPENCPTLWDESSRAGADRLLPGVLARLEDDVFPELCAAMNETPRLVLFIVGLLQSPRNDSVKLTTVQWAVKHFDEDSLCQLLVKHRRCLPAQFPWKRTCLAERLDAIFQQMPASGNRFAQRMELLEGWLDYCSDPGATERLLAGWKKVHDALERLRAAEEEKDSSIAGRLLTGKKSAGPNELGKQMADGIWDAMPMDRYPDDASGGEKLKTLRSLGAATLKTDDFLPQQVWRTMGGYFHKKSRNPRLAKWVVQETAAQKQRRGNWVWGLTMALGAAGAVMGIIVYPRSTGEPKAAVVPDDAKTAATAKTSQSKTGRPAQPPPAAVKAAAKPSEPAAEPSERAAASVRQSTTEKADPREVEKTPAAKSGQTPEKPTTSERPRSERGEAPPANKTASSRTGRAVNPAEKPTAREGPKLRGAANRFARWNDIYEDPASAPAGTLRVSRREPLVQQYSLQFLGLNQQSTVSVRQIPHKRDSIDIVIVDNPDRVLLALSAMRDGSIKYRWLAKPTDQEKQAIKDLRDGVLELRDLNGPKHIALRRTFEAPRLPMKNGTARITPETLASDAKTLAASICSAIEHYDLRIGGGKVFMGGQAFAFGEGGESASVPELAKQLDVPEVSLRIVRDDRSVHKYQLGLVAEPKENREMGHRDGSKERVRKEAAGSLFEDVEGISIRLYRVVEDVRVDVVEFSERTGGGDKSPQSQEASP